MRGHRDLAWVSAAAIACGLVALLVPLEALRVVAGLPLALFLPGYALTALAFGRQPIAIARVLLLSTAMTLAILAIGALLLTLVGIYPGTWALLLVLFTLAACRGAALRRGRAPERKQRRDRRGRLRRRDLAFLGGAAALAVIAIVLAQIPFAADKAAGYTALWMLPGNNGHSVEIGVVSARHVPGPYVLEIEAGDESVISKRFRLDPGEEQVYRLPVPAVSGERVVASLYREGRPTHLYRRVSAFIGTEDGS